MYFALKNEKPSSPVLQVDEQTKVIQAITSVIQALAPGEAISPVEVSCSVAA